jgi:hypothetical protein
MFVARSTTRPARTFTEIVGVQPAEVNEVGDLASRSSGRRYDEALWTLESEPAEGGEALNEVCRELLSRFDGRHELVRSLRNEFTMQLRCWGTSDSGQGGFWLSAEVVQGIAALGCEFYCTVYFDDDAADQ